ncbi:MAG: YjgN family protein [Pseudomonadota bacterium]
MNYEAPPEAESTRLNDFSFTGSALEYFGIWIVNLLLSILTLGIYTAWAKVRRQRYFYGNTWLDGHNFEYHARPMQILIGRVIVIGYLVLINVLNEVNPILGLILTIPYLLALPWVFNKAISFNARMTSYRNVHFNFRGSYWRALGIFIGLPLLAFVPLGIVAGIAGIVASGDAGSAVFVAVLLPIAFLAAILFIPFVSRASTNYIGNNTSFGDAGFSIDVGLKPIYANLGASVLFCIASTIGITVIIGGLFVLITGAELNPEAVQNPLNNIGTFALFFLIGILAYSPFILAYLFYSAGMRNIAFNAAYLDGKHRLASRISRTRYLWIIVSNAAATILSVALLRPWAAVRTWRYLTFNTYFASQGSLDSFINVQEDKGNVIAAEYLDIDGIDFGL